MARVLVVEDDESIRRMVVMALRQAGHAVTPAVDGEQALAEFGRGHPDVVVLDLLLPGIDGGEVCRRIRVGSQVPILMLTALAREEDVVNGLEMGADDYLTKPFGIREMLARVSALLRRGAAESGAKPAGAIGVGDLVVDPDRHVVLARGERVDLTPTEFRLLHCLARNAGRVVPARVLIREAQEYDCDDREAQDIVKVHIRHIRHKLEPDPSSPRYIVNVRGVGYVLVPTEGGLASESGDGQL
jgi:DNA-binding response OmpR family regulator